MYDTSMKLWNVCKKNGLRETKMLNIGRALHFEMPMPTVASFIAFIHSRGWDQLGLPTRITRGHEPREMR